MSKKSTKVAPEEETKAPVETPTVAAEAPVTPPEANPDAKYSVYDLSFHLVRSYTVVVHGPEAPALARQYADKIHGMVKVE